MNLLATEINAKYFSAQEIKSGKGVKVNTIKSIYTSEFDMAKDARTMIESGIWTIDDVRELLGSQRLNTPVTTQHYLTKNIQPLNKDGTVAE